MQKNKKCCDCGKTKSVENFTIRKNKRGTETIYYNPICKPCMVIRSINYRINNRKKYNAYQNQYHKTRYATDPAFRIKADIYKAKYYKNRYHTDPVFRAKILARRSTKYHAQKALALQAVSNG